jgi:hypothetical protein
VRNGIWRRGTRSPDTECSGKARFGVARGREIPGSGRVALVLAALALLPVACGGSDRAPSPFQPDEGGEGGEGGACDDEIDCTDDSCDATLGRCRFIPQHLRCQDEVFCNGVELCEAGLGCKLGPPVSCSDDSTCTIDVCVEATRSCESRPRDADGDGDPIRNCGGGDCLDTDPSVHSGASEVCGNLRDDDCDGSVDGPGCVEPAYDSCAEPLKVTESGRHDLSLAATVEDFPLSCTPNIVGMAHRDVVVALVVPDDATDVVVSAIGLTTTPTLGLAESCADASSELVCSSGVELDEETRLGAARTVFRGLAPATYPLFVSGTGDAKIELDVEFREATPPPDNETCGTAAPIFPDENVVRGGPARRHALRSAVELRRSARRAGLRVRAHRAARRRAVGHRARRLRRAGAVAPRRRLRRAHE